MFRRVFSLFPLLLCMAAVGGSARAQSEKTITIRMLDAKTGLPIESSSFLVQINHQKTVHPDWVQQSEDKTEKSQDEDNTGTPRNKKSKKTPPVEDKSVTLKLPADATAVLIHATYDSALRTYINCDAAKDKPAPVDHWYAVSDILATGVVAPNECGKSKATAKPGEFVFYVRQLNWMEQWKDE